MKCQCYTAVHKQCTRIIDENSPYFPFCWQHKKCKNVVRLKKAIKKKKSRSKSKS